MKPPHHCQRRRSGDRDPWPLVWSLTIHVWFVGLAMGLVWRFWAGHDAVPTPALLEPGDGGERAAFLSMKPKQESRVAAVVNRVKSLQSAMPSEVATQPKHATVAQFSPVSQPYLPGGGWNGGVGKSLAHGQGGDGYGSGQGFGASAFICLCGSLRPRVNAQTQIRGFDHLVIVLDISGSMRAKGGAEENPPPLREFISCVSTLRADVFFNVVCFAGKVEQSSGDSLTATPENVASAVAWARNKFRQPRFDEAPPAPAGTSGTSRLDLGLHAALQHRPQEVLLISDGQPVVREGNRSLPHGAILAGVRTAVPDYAESPVIHTIAMRESGSGFLRRLAADFGGTYRSAASD